MKDGKRVVITYGTFDLFHYGHIALLERAKQLGDCLIVGVTSDLFDQERGKLNVRQSLDERMASVTQSGLADKVIVEEYRGQKISDIQKYSVDVFAIGSDWEGKFDYLQEYCQVVYLERTRGISSTMLRDGLDESVSLGYIGVDYIADRMARESSHVGGIRSVLCYDEDIYKAKSFSELHEGMLVVDSLPELLSAVDAVYISKPIDKRAGFVFAALAAGCHVLCEGPIFLSTADARRAYEMSDKLDLVLMEACKTRYFPAYKHLRLMLQSGLIGEIKDIDASFSHVFDDLDKTDKYQGSFYDLASYVLLPAVDLIGSDFVSASLIGWLENDFCIWTKCNLLYPSASVTVKAGRGIKTEGDMVITGTKGYVYVPSPWWKIDYFEVRTEDLRNVRKFYYEYIGEGQRYELHEFVSNVVRSKTEGLCDMHRMSVFAVTRVVEQFDQGCYEKLTTCKFSGECGESVVL